MDIFEEVVNDINYERRVRLFRKLLPAFIILTILATVGFAGYNWYLSKITNRNQKTGDLFIDLTIKNVDDQQLITAFLKELAQNEDNKQVELAEIQLVYNLIQNQELIKALAKLETIASNKKYGEITTAYARMMWLSLLLDQEDISQDQHIKAAEYISFFNNQEQVFYMNVLLIKALYYTKIGKHDQALGIVESILQMPTSNILKEQAKAILSSLTLLKSRD